MNIRQGDNHCPPGGPFPSPADPGADLARDSMPAATRFTASERDFRLRQRGVAEGVTQGLGAMSIRSLQALVAAGADEPCRRMQAVHGQDVWGHRRRALQLAIQAAVAAGPPDAGRHPSGPACGRTLANP